MGELKVLPTPITDNAITALQKIIQLEAQFAQDTTMKQADYLSQRRELQIYATGIDPKTLTTKQMLENAYAQGDAYINAARDFIYGKRP